MKRSAEGAPGTTGEVADGRGAFSLIGRVALVVLGVIVLAGLVAVVLLLLGGARGVLRPVLAMLMAVAIAWFGIGYFRQLGNPPPPDPQPVAIDRGLGLAYVCEMCGLELAVVVAAKDKAPKHCGEAMILTRS